MRSSDGVFRIGTRGSKLALWQANHVAELLGKAVPGLPVQVKVIHTTGDKIRDVALSKIGDKGLFTKELERALEDDEIDCAVHSMKDVPTVLPDGMILGAILERADVRDVLVASGGSTLEGLPAGSKVGTGSLRRRAQLKALRPDLDYVELRGNLDTRIDKVKSGQLDAAVLAAAGIDRMGWSDVIAQHIDPSILIPAVGQGAIGVEIRGRDDMAGELCGYISDEKTFICVAAERHVMRELEGGCQVPIGSYARFIEGDEGRERMQIDSMVASLDGSRLVRSQLQGSKDDVIALAQGAVDELVAKGARDILDEVRTQGEIGA